MKNTRNLEAGVRAELPCRWCQGMGLFRTTDIVAACLRCKRCRECGRDRLDPCADCLHWDAENRGHDGKVLIHGVRERRKLGE